MSEQKPIKRSYILAALMLTMMLAAMDSTIVSTAVPQIVSDLGGFSKFTWVFSIYLLTQTVTIPIYGKLSDVFGRKKILLLGIVIFLMGSVACALSWNIMTLIIFRGLQGIGAGSIMASVNTIAGDIYTIKERAKIQGWLSSIWGISAILGPILGGFFAEYINWRWIFLINLPIGALSISFLVIYFKESLSPHEPSIDYKGSFWVLIAVGLLIVYLLEGGHSFPWLGAIGWIFIGAILFSLWRLIRVEAKAKEPIMPAWIWGNPAFAFANIGMVFMGIVMMGPEVFLPTFLQSSLSIEMIASGLILGTMSLSWPLSSAFSGRLYLKIGFRNTGLIGGLLLFLACVGFLLIPWPQPIPLIIVDQLLMGAGFGLISTPILVGIQNMVYWDQRGVVTGLNVFCRNLGQSLGAAIFGAIFNNSFNYQMKKAPGNLKIKVNELFDFLKNPELGVTQKYFLQKVVNESTFYIFIGLCFFAVLLFIALSLMPQKLPQVSLLSNSQE